MHELKTVAAFYRSVTGVLPHPPDELLLSYVENRVSPREQSRIEAHLEACLQCREDFQMLRHFAQSLPSAPLPPLVMTAVEEEQDDVPFSPLRLSVTPAQEPVPATVPEPPAPPARPTPKPALISSKPRRATPASATSPTPRRPLPYLIPGIFLAVNALGLGALYGALTRNQAAPTVKNTPATPITSTKPGDNLAQLQSAYERLLAQERGKSAGLEKRLQKLKQAPAPKSAAQAPSVKGERLLEPGELALAQSAVSLSVHPGLTWKSVSRARSYAAELTDATGKVVVKTQLKDNEWRVAAALLRGQTYHWSVTALDRDDKPLGVPQTGEVAISSDEDAARLSEQLKALATELSRLGYTTDSQTLTERAESLLKK